MITTFNHAIRENSKNLKYSNQYAESFGKSENREQNLSNIFCSV